MADQAFNGSGKKAGLEIWRIENFAPVKQAKANGKLYKGDSYILLSTTQSKSGALSWAIHFWLGSETSQDEAGVAAYKTVELDGYLGGGAVQFREVEGNESSQFLSYFKSTGGIEYLPGGVSSGFKHVERDVYETRLLLCKGKRTVRVTQVPLSNKSLNKGDVFILDAGLTIYIFNGELANKYEKAKGVEVASNINSDQRGGKAQIVVVNDDIKIDGFWSPLGGFVEPSSLPEGESDDVIPKKAANRLFKVFGEGKDVQFTEVPLPDGKLKKEFLDTNDVFIVAASKVFIWVGSRSTLEEKKEAFPRAAEVIAKNGYPSNTSIERVSEGSESSSFKAEFSVWNPPISFSSASKSGPKAADPTIDVKALLERKAVEDTPVDDGSGKLTVWVIKNFEKVEVPVAKHGQFYGGDSYILLYTYIKNKKEEHIIYFWLGRDTSIDEQGSAALLVKELDASLGGIAVQIRVTQGKEPPHFRQLFKGRLVVYSGGNASGFANLAQSDSINTSGISLFHVKGTNSLNTYAGEVKAVASNLNSEDTFLLQTPTAIFIWRGEFTNPDEVSVASNIAQILRRESSADVITVSEGTEPAEFWTALGGKTEYSKIAPGEDAPRPPRLFEASTKTGVFKVEEVDNFDQTDLNDEDVFLLDIFTQVFVWVGSQSSQEEKNKASEFAKSFVSNASDGRSDSIPVIIVHAGSEPSFFTSQFHLWDPEYAKKHTFVDPYQAKLEALKEANARKRSESTAAKLKHVEADSKAAAPLPSKISTPALKPTGAKVGDSPAPAAATAPVVETPAVVYKTPAQTGFFSLETLKGEAPPGVDPSKKEDYLDNAAFMSAIGVDRAAFAAQPKWKRDQKKKDLGIF